MISIYAAINLTLDLAGLAIALSLLTGLLITKAYKTKLARILLVMLIGNCLLVMCDAIAWGLDGRTGSYVRPVLLTVNFLVFILGTLYTVLVSYYLITYITYKRPERSGWFMHTMVLLCCLMFGLTICLQFAGRLFYIDEYNVFHAGPFNYVYIAYTFLIIILNAVYILKNQKYLDLRDTGILMLFLLIPAIATIIEAINQNIMIIYFSSTVAYVILYVSIQIRQEVHSLAVENELKMSVMLSQIQPHFLFNSLNAIGNLCLKDPTEAHLAIINFSLYLRGNMDSITQKEPIPFTKELEHTRLYLSLEKCRFNERLQVVYDIRTEQFLLPVLTLQPIVENAVKYSVAKRMEEAVIIIRTKETEHSYRIEVKDDGIGFGTEGNEKDGRSHIGLENVRSRLAVVCSGRLFIDSTPGEGTTVVMEIPKGET